jgi:hypothetical protein
MHKKCKRKKKNESKKLRALCWISYCVNDGRDVERGSLQMMKCILCYNSVMNALNPSTKECKGLITYYKTME